MNALELHAPKGTPCGVFICGECKYTRPSQEQAEQCCRPNICKCGAESGRTWLVCAACRHRDAEARDEARWAKASKVPAGDYAGWVYDDDKDEFHSDVGAFVDAWECDHEEGDEPRGRLYACVPMDFALNAADMLESATQDHHEDAYDDFDAGAVNELQAFLDGWAQANAPTSVQPDYSRAIVLPSHDLEAT